MRRTTCCAFIVFGGMSAAPCASGGQEPDAGIAEGTLFVPGVFEPGRQPDGNSLVFRGPTGLVVFDTGRHREHTQRLLDAAKDAKQPIVAVINSHWHLDHVGGNAMLRDAFPELRVYASPAIEQAMQGFLADYRAQLVRMIERSAADPKAQAGFLAELGLIDAGARLYPDESIVASKTWTLAGRELQLNYEVGAVTGGDVWVFDPATRVLAAGDLVTLPVPFFDTACPAHWRAALARLDKVDFAMLVPGHGAPMSRERFARYRIAFDRLLDCAAGASEKSVCAEGWIRDTGDLLPPAQQQAARGMLDYYFDTSLRVEPAKLASRCGA